MKKYYTLSQACKDMVQAIDEGSDFVDALDWAAYRLHNGGECWTYEEASEALKGWYDNQYDKLPNILKHQAS